MSTTHCFILTQIFFFKQISRLTWFTRFDPVKPEAEERNVNVITIQTSETSVAGEPESTNGQAHQHRSGRSLAYMT